MPSLAYPIVIIEQLIVILLIKFFIFNFFNFRRISLFKSINIHVLFKTAIMVSFSAIILVILNYRGYLIRSFDSSLFFMDAGISWISIILFHLLFTEIWNFKKSHYNVLSQESIEKRTIRTLIIGTDQTAQVLFKLLSLSDISNLNLIGFVSEDPSTIGLKIHGARVYGPYNKISDIVTKHGIEQLIISESYNCSKTINDIKSLAAKLSVDIVAIPSYLDFLMNHKGIRMIKGFKVENLVTHNQKKMYTPTIITSKIDQEEIFS